MQFTKVEYLAEELLATVPDVWVDHIRRCVLYPVGVDHLDPLILQCIEPDTNNKDQDWCSFDCEIRYTCGMAIYCQWCMEYGRRVWKFKFKSFDFCCDSR